MDIDDMIFWVGFIFITLLVIPIIVVLWVSAIQLLTSGF